MSFYPNPWSFIDLGEWHGMKDAMLRWLWWSLHCFCILGLSNLLEREGKQFDKSTPAFTCCFIPSWLQTTARVRILSDWYSLPSISLSFFFLVLFFFLANYHFQQNKSSTDLERWDVSVLHFPLCPQLFSYSIIWSIPVLLHGGLRSSSRSLLSLVREWGIFFATSSGSLLIMWLNRECSITAFFFRTILS